MRRNLPWFMASLNSQNVFPAKSEPESSQYLSISKAMRWRILNCQTRNQTHPERTDQKAFPPRELQALPLEPETVDAHCVEAMKQISLI